MLSLLTDGLTIPVVKSPLSRSKKLAFCELGIRAQSRHTLLNH
jgi:hypothetical protein